MMINSTEMISRLPWVGFHKPTANIKALVSLPEQHLELNGGDVRFSSLSVCWFISSVCKLCTDDTWMEACPWSPSLCRSGVVSSWRQFCKSLRLLAIVFSQLFLVKNRHVELAVAELDDAPGSKNASVAHGCACIYQQVINFALPQKAKTRHKRWSKRSAIKDILGIFCSRVCVCVPSWYIRTMIWPYTNVLHRRKQLQAQRSKYRRISGRWYTSLSVIDATPRGEGGIPIYKLYGYVPP